jgi:hypothetical protein
MVTCSRNFHQKSIYIFSPTEGWWIEHQIFTISKVAKHENFTIRLPGVNGLSFSDYKIPASPVFSAYAGHIQWPQRLKLENITDSISCVTNFREPVSRIVSCLYFRFLQGKCINYLSLEALEKLLWKKDIFGFSCLNEPFRILSGTTGKGDEELLDHLENNAPVWRKKPSTSKTASRNNLAQSRSRLLLKSEATSIFEQTLLHVSQCSPLVLEMPQSFNLSNRRFISLKNSSSQLFVTEKHSNTGKKGSVCSAPVNKHLEMIKLFCELETLLYDAIYKKVQSAIVYDDGDIQRGLRV